MTTRNRRPPIKLPVRHMDGSGRIALPLKVRRQLNLLKDDEFTVEVVNGCIVLRPTGEESCECCGGTGRAS